MSLWNASIESLPLPTRMANVAARLGLATVGDLARRHPASLLLERNLGRTTVAETRTVLERAMGMRWEISWHRSTKVQLQAPGVATPGAWSPSGGRVSASRTRARGPRIELSKAKRSEHQPTEHEQRLATSTRQSAPPPVRQGALRFVARRSRAIRLVEHSAGRYLRRVKLCSLRLDRRAKNAEPIMNVRGPGGAPPWCVRSKVRGLVPAVGNHA